MLVKVLWYMIECQNGVGYQIRSACIYLPSISKYKQPAGYVKAFDSIQVEVHVVSGAAKAENFEMFTLWISEEMKSQMHNHKATNSEI